MLPTEPQPPTDFQPNRAEKALGWIGAFTVAPLLLPFLPLLKLLLWARSPADSKGMMILKRAVTPVAALAVFVGFLLVAVLAIPYTVLYAVLRALGIVRKPPADQLE